MITKDELKDLELKEVGGGQDRTRPVEKHSSSGLEKMEKCPRCGNDKRKYVACPNCGYSRSDEFD